MDLYCYIKVLKVKPVYQQMTLSPKLGVLEISILWHFRLPLLIQMFIKVASSPRLSGIGMPSPILWSHLLKMQTIVLRSSLLWWELRTNSLITGPGEWLSFRRFTSKPSWSWSWSPISWPHFKPLAQIMYEISLKWPKLQRAITLEIVDEFCLKSGNLHIIPYKLNRFRAPSWTTFPQTLLTSLICSNLQRTITPKILDGVCSKVNQVIYSLSYQLTKFQSSSSNDVWDFLLTI